MCLNPSEYEVAAFKQALHPHLQNLPHVKACLFTNTSSVQFLVKGNRLCPTLFVWGGEKLILRWKYDPVLESVILIENNFDSLPIISAQWLKDLMQELMKRKPVILKVFRKAANHHFKVLEYLTEDRKPSVFLKDLKWRLLKGP